MRQLSDPIAFIPYPWKYPLSNRVCLETGVEVWYRLVNELIFPTGVQIGRAYNGRSPDRYSEWGRIRTR